jgi:hypothetical protein
MCKPSKNDGDIDKKIIYTGKIRTKHIEDSGELDASFEIIPPPRYLHHNVRMPNIQPVPAGGNQHESIAKLMMRKVPVVKFPAHPVIPRKGAFSKDSLDVAQNLCVNEHPKVFEMADWDNVKANTYSACYQVVVKQAIP